MENQTLHTNALVEKVEGKLVAVASEEVEDRHGEIIEIDGWNLKNFKKNPQLLWMHNLTHGRSLPIGKAEKTGFRMIDGKKKLVFEPVFEEITKFGRTVKRFFEEGWLNTFSVGFIGKEKEENRYLKQELLEISAVPVPALASAEIISRAKTMSLDESTVKAILGEEKEEKGGISGTPPKNKPRNPKNPRKKPRRKPRRRKTGMEDLRDTLELVDGAVRIALSKLNRGGVKTNT